MERMCTWQATPSRWRLRGVEVEDISFDRSRCGNRARERQSRLCADTAESVKDESHSFGQQERALENRCATFLPQKKRRAGACTEKHGFEKIRRKCVEAYKKRLIYHEGRSRNGFRARMNARAFRVHGRSPTCSRARTCQNLPDMTATGFAEAHKRRLNAFSDHNSTAANRNG
eukprot:6177947-Pleurochrysis_carterae.AAC.1